MGSNVVRKPFDVRTEEAVETRKLTTDGGAAEVGNEWLGVPQGNILFVYYRLYTLGKHESG